MPRRGTVLVYAWVNVVILLVQIRRFVRYNLGEGIEKKTQDFAAEVAAQTGQ